MYFIQQHQLKEQAEKKLLSTLDDSLFEKFDAATPGIVWEEEGREFYLNDRLYDVAKTKTVDGKKILYCVNDYNEEALLEKFIKDLQAGADNANGQHGKHSIKLHQPDLVIENANEPVMALPAEKAMLYPAFLVSLTENIKEVNTPPPNKMHI